MAKAYNAEYAQWLHDNNFSQADEKLLLKTVTSRMFIWFLLSCIPGVGYFVLPLFMNAWSWRLILRKKSLEPRPGLLYSFCALAMYITFIAIIPWIIWALAKRNQWGTGIRRLIKKGKVGNGAVHTDVDADEASPAAPLAQEKKRRFPWWILVILPIILVGVAMFFGLTDRTEPMGAETAVLQNYEGNHVDMVTAALENLGVQYKITYVTASDKTPGTVIGQSPAPGSALDEVSSVELVVVSQMVHVPDFSAAATVDEITALAQQNDLTVTLIYIDEAAGLTYDSIPEGMVIEGIDANYAPGAEVEPGSEITVTIRLNGQYVLVGDWYFAECLYGSLYLTQYTFREDGTFSYYYMGYMPVDYSTDLYTYGTYWDGAMGADSYEGTYILSGDQFTLCYNFWNWELNINDYAQRTHTFAIQDGALHLSYSDNTTTKYLPGSQPDRDAVLPFSIAGSWYALGTPVSDEFGSRSMAVYTFLFFEDGTFKSGHHHYLNDGSNWYFPGAGSTFTGEYTFDGTNLVLHCTAELQSVFNNDGDYMGTESVPIDNTYCYVLTVKNGEITDVAQNSAQLRCFIRVHPSPYVNIDIMGAPLDHANQLYP